MPNPSEEDLFKDSTMTFGEHLDELRTALFKAVIAVTIGFAIGLMFLGNWVFDRVKEPLEDALEQYYMERAEKSFAARIAEQEKQGVKIAPELKDPEYVKQLVYGDRMLFDEAYLDPSSVIGAMKEKYPEIVGDIDLPERKAGMPPRKDELVRIFLWHTIADDSRVRVTSLNPQEVFLLWMKASMIAGFVLASPAAFYFIWQFVAAGLYPQEKSYVHIFMPFSIGLFLLGAAVAYFLAFPKVLEFFLGFNAWLNVDMEPRISEWMSFVLLLPIGFGASFQLPLVMLFLNRIGVFTTATYLASWRMAVLVMAIIAMVITPTGDPYTMGMLLAPLTLLYFGGILLCKWMPARGPSARR